MNQPIQTEKKPKVSASEPVFGVNEMRLNARLWLMVAGLVALITWITPRLWTKIERFEISANYRIPYNLSQDYWLYERRLGQVSDPAKIIVLGDSVVWGEYVLPDGTLSAFLNQEAGQTDQFINGGVNGLFPLALEGLEKYYGGALKGRKIVLQCNVLWMSSAKADLQTSKEEKFNHSHLVPQYFPRIPCYRADANTRLSALIERNVGFVAWVGHLQSAYFNDKSILNWTLQDDGNDPPRYPNAYKNPFAQIALSIPSAPRDDPQRGPKSSRHKPWNEGGNGPVQFEWVELGTSLQWGAFQRIVEDLRQRGNDVFVILGPFNEHMIAEESRPPYRKIHEGIANWLAQRQIPHDLPATLPSALYADASHPLTEGYALLARHIYQNANFQSWLRKGSH